MSGDVDIIEGWGSLRVCSREAIGVGTEWLAGADVVSQCKAWGGLVREGGVQDGVENQ